MSPYQISDLPPVTLKLVLYFLIYLTGLIIAFVRRKRSPITSLLSSLGFILLIIEAFAWEADVILILLSLLNADLSVPYGLIKLISPVSPLLLIAGWTLVIFALFFVKRPVSPNA